MAMPHNSAARLVTMAALLLLLLLPFSYLFTHNFSMYEDMDAY